MHPKELRAFILENWGDIIDISDKVSGDDLLKVLDERDELLTAILECVRIMHPRSPLRIKLKELTLKMEKST